MTIPQRWADGHLDLAYLAVNGRNITRPTPAHLDACMSLPALRDAHVDLVFATIFTEINDTAPNAAEHESQMYEPGNADAAHRAGLAQLDSYHQLESAGEISIVRAADDLVGDASLPRIVILMEGADPIRNPAEARWWHDRGLRIVGLTWARGSRYSGGNATGGGLTDDGRALIAVLDELNIIHDLSHLSEQASFELLVPTSGERNLSGAQIKAIADRNGVIGLNLFSRFLAHNRRATIDDCITHIEHICDVMGRRNGIALGSDMDGGFPASKLAEGVDHPGKLHALIDALRNRGWTDDDLLGFASENWMNLLRAAL